MDIIGKMSSVLQQWVMELGWKSQSILLSGLRGPDTGSYPAIKKVNRWLRTISQNNADPSKDYMSDDGLPELMSVCDELEWLSCHYVHHFADSLRVVGLWHPMSSIRDYANELHELIAEEIFHFTAETKEHFRQRHADNRPRNSNDTIS